MNLKFRAWHKHTKKYHEMVAINFLYKNITILDDNKIRMVLSLDDFILEEHTRMKDKNGKEIYVGDVFKIKHGYNWKKESHFEVVFSRSYGYILRNKDGDWFPLKDKCKSYEIIGNVHEIGEKENVRFR